MKNNINILIVDDEEIMRSLLSKILSHDNYNIQTVEDGVEAVEVLEKEKVDIIISDMKMPRMNGFELLKHVKANHPDIGMIIMTAFGDTYTVKDALLLGADEYITKPFKSYEISMVVEKTYWRILSANNKKQEAVKA